MEDFRLEVQKKGRGASDNRSDSTVICSGAQDFSTRPPSLAAVCGELFNTVRLLGPPMTGMVLPQVALAIKLFRWLEHGQWKTFAWRCKRREGELLIKGYWDVGFRPREAVLQAPQPRPRCRRGLRRLQPCSLRWRFEAWRL